LILFDRAFEKSTFDTVWRLVRRHCPTPND
jgi:hypothetical protein